MIRTILPRRQPLCETFTAGVIRSAESALGLHSPPPTDFCRIVSSDSVEFLRVTLSRVVLSDRWRLVRARERERERAQRARSADGAVRKRRAGKWMDVTRRDWRPDNCSAPARRVDLGQDATEMGLTAWSVAEVDCPFFLYLCIALLSHLCPCSRNHLGLKLLTVESSTPHRTKFLLCHENVVLRLS